MRVLALLALLAGDGGVNAFSVATNGARIDFGAGASDVVLDAGHRHCWHVASIQHAVPCHSDEVCCHCGEERCRRTEFCSLGPQPGHGKYANGYVITLGSMYITAVDGGLELR